MVNDFSVLITCSPFMLHKEKPLSIKQHEQNHPSNIYWARPIPPNYIIYTYQCISKQSTSWLQREHFLKVLIFMYCEAQQQGSTNTKQHTNKSTQTKAKQAHINTNVIASFMHAFYGYYHSQFSRTYKFTKRPGTKLLTNNPNFGCIVFPVEYTLSRCNWQHQEFISPNLLWCHLPLCKGTALLLWSLRIYQKIFSAFPTSQSHKFFFNDRNKKGHSLFRITTRLGYAQGTWTWIMLEYYTYPVHI